MIFKQATLRIWIVTSKSVPGLSDACIVRKTVISSDRVNNVTRRTESTVNLNRNKQGTSDMYKHSKTLSCDNCKTFLAGSERTRPYENCLIECPKDQKRHSKQSLINENLHRHVLLGVSQDHFKTVYRSFCKTSTTGEGDGASQTWEYLVKYDQLSPQEVKIHEKHRDAVKAGKLMYVDPQTGYHVMTRLAHLERGSCCGNACRHCPYGQESMQDPKKLKKFNSAFYV